MTAEQLAKGTDIYERCECLKRDCASLTKGMQAWIKTGMKLLKL